MDLSFPLSILHRQIRLLLTRRRGSADRVDRQDGGGILASKAWKTLRTPESDTEKVYRITKTSVSKDQRTRTFVKGSWLAIRLCLEEKYHSTRGALVG